MISFAPGWPFWEPVFPTLVHEKWPFLAKDRPFLAIISPKSLATFNPKWVGNTVENGKEGGGGVAESLLQKCVFNRWNAIHFQTSCNTLSIFYLVGASSIIKSIKLAPEKWEPTKKMYVFFLHLFSPKKKKRIKKKLRKLAFMFPLRSFEWKWSQMSVLLHIHNY